MTQVKKDFIEAFRKLGASESVISTLISAVKTDEDVFSISREILRIGYSK